MWCDLATSTASTLRAVDLSPDLTQRVRKHHELEGTHMVHQSHLHGPSQELHHVPEVFSQHFLSSVSPGGENTALGSLFSALPASG